MATPGTIGAGDRLGATLALSAIAFGVLILGVGFARDLAAPVTPTLDVILTQTRTDEPPDAGVAPETMVAQAPPVEPDPTPRVLATTGASEAAPLPEDQRETEPSPLPPGAEPIEQSLEMARLAAEIERRQELMAKRPKRKFVSASTREYEYAAYLRAWVAKVERVGTLNYPDDARRRGLGGRLVMTVAVRRDGSVEEIVLNRPSGLGVLDQAASRIVRLAEPFPPLPQTAENIDVLHITRTWDFQNGSLAGE